MHVCFLTHEYPLPNVGHGGVGSFIKTLGKKLVEYGHRVSIVGVGYPEDKFILDEGIQVYPLRHSNLKFGKFIENSWQINNLLSRIHKEFPIDIVESTEIGLAFIKKNQTISYVIRMHGGHHFFTIAEKRPREKWKVFQEKRSFKKADAFIAVSNYVAEVTNRYLPIKHKIKVIYNPVDLNLFPAYNLQNTIKNQLLFVGTICEKKGVRQLVQAMPFIKEHFPDVNLNIVGREWRFPKTGYSYTNYLKEFITPSIENNIKIIGAVSNNQIPGLLEKAEICVFPSHMEAMPIAWIEALAMGKPVVGSKEGPGSETIFDKNTGLLADPHNPKDIADKIIYLLNNKEIARKMGRSAREDVLQRFDINKCIIDNISFYESVKSN